MNEFSPQGFSADIFRKRYSFTDTETWFEACERLARQNVQAEPPDKQKIYYNKFRSVLVSNLFVPGGRIWYGSGRTSPNLLNCFVLSDKLDSKEGWGNIAKEMIITSMAQGGCGIDFSDIRPRSSLILGHGGTCPGPIEAMKLIDACAAPVKAGGGRRVALMFSLDLDHPDINEFLDAKLVNGQLTHANVSVRSKHTTKFIDAVKSDGDWELSWKGKHKRVIKARDLWKKIVTNAYNSAEPGFLNWEKVLEEANTTVFAPPVTTNPCFAPETLITTKNGLFRIDELVGKEVEILSNGNWSKIDNFRITANNQDILKIGLYDGSFVRVTPYHSMILEDGSRKEAKNLSVGDKLKISTTESHGATVEKGAYLKGFLVGDGCVSGGKPILYLYYPKYQCDLALIESAREIPNGAVHTNAIEDLYFSNEVNHKRKSMSGLSPKKHDLVNWASIYKTRLPKEIFQWTKESKVEFICGVMDADGSDRDSKNGFGYQISSIHKGWLLDFQNLLKTFGVYSKIGLMKPARIAEIKGQEFKCVDCFRLTISQISAKQLATVCKFRRLSDFSDREIKNVFKTKFNSVVSIESDGIEPNVYCCTVENTHSLTISNSIEVGQCGEIPLGPYDCCCLGHLVLPRFVSNGNVNWHLLAETIRTGVRFLDNILTVNQFPLPEMKQTSDQMRRIGLGTTGLADMLVLLGLSYGSPTSLSFIDKLYRFISKQAYEASIMLAVEKGEYPLCDRQAVLNSGYMQRMPKKTRSLFQEYGMRNCNVLTVAPTGTVSILSDNCSSGIEPMFSAAYERRYWDGDQRKTELVFHPLFAKFMKEGKSVEHFVSSRELTVKQHMDVQKTVQEHVDQAVSKTINIPEDYSMQNVEDLWLEYLPYLKGTTFYRENTRGYVDKDGKIHEPPLKAISLDEAKERFNENNKTEVMVNDCVSGVCEI